MTILATQILPPVIARPENIGHHIRLGNAGRDPVLPCIFSLCFDDSGSLTGGNDPVGARYEEVQLALRHIGAASHTSTQQLVIFRLDHPQVAPVGPLPLHTKRTREKLLNGVYPPTKTIGSSMLTPAMSAMNQFAEKHPSVHRVAVIFSDFELADLNPAQAYEEMAKFPGTIHAVVMNATPPPALTNLPNVCVTRVSSTDPPGRLAAALAHSLTAHRPGATPARYENQNR